MKNKKTVIISLMVTATACIVAGSAVGNVRSVKAENTEEVFDELGASVRMLSKEDKGIRFAFGLPEDKTGDDYQIGTLIIPKEVLDEYGDAELNHNLDTSDEVRNINYEDIKCSKKWVPHDSLNGAAKDGYNYYNAALVDIPDVHYNTIIVARSYYVYNGEYYYSNTVERSIGYVASAALNNGEIDSNDILAGFVTGGYGDTTHSITGDDFIAVSETTKLTADNEVNYLPVWSSSNKEVATIDKDGTVRPVKGGETTITATIAGKSASKTVYVVGDGLYSDQIGVRINGWNMTGNADYFSIVDNNGEMTATTKFIADDTYNAGLIIRNMYSKAYYETLIAKGYEQLVFNLKVEGDVTDLYVFGKALSVFPQENGVYAITVNMQQFISYYDTMYTIATSGNQVGQASSLSAKFITWKSAAAENKQERDYVFTISNAKYVIPTLNMDFAAENKAMIAVGETTTLTATTNMSGLVWSSSNNAIATVENGVVTGVKGGEVTITAKVGELTASKTIYVVGDGLYSDQIGMRINGNDVSGQSQWLSKETSENGATVITAKFQANATYAPALTLRNIYSKAYYEKLIAEGYTKFAFNLAVEGELDELYVFGKAINTFPIQDGVYAIAIDTQHFVTYYDTINTIATSGSAVGQASSISAKFITWKSPANDWSSKRNYVFTISNAEFAPDATLEVNADKNEIAYGETATLTATTNWDESFVVWTTSDATIATVENGVVTVTGEKWGDVIITATVATVSVDVTITVKEPAQLEVSFEQGTELVKVGETTMLRATTDWNVNSIVWSTSDENIATVEKGVVTANKGGEVTITATLGDLTASKTVYVVGDGLYSNQIGARMNGWNMSSNADYCGVTTGTNGELTITSKFLANATYSPALVLRNIYSKTYYETLIANGYTKLTFNLAVEGDVSELYVFGKALNTFPESDGVYAVSIEVQHIVNHYDTIHTIATSDKQVGQASSLAAKLISWKSPANDWNSTRNYTFEISNPAFSAAPTQLKVDLAEGCEDTIEVGKTTTFIATTDWSTNYVVWSSSDETVATVENGVVTGLKAGEVTITATLGDLTATKTIYVKAAPITYNNQIGARIHGNDVSGQSQWISEETSENGAMVITAKFQADATYSPALILKNLADKATYEELIASGYAHLTFNLKVEGDVSELYVFGKTVTSFVKNADGAYAVSIEIQHIVTQYANISTIATSDKQAGQAGSLSAKFITWKSPAGDYTSIRNYTFTITNAGVRQGVLSTDDFGFRDGGVNKTYDGMNLQVGANGEIIIGVTFNATASYGSFLMFNNMNTITELAALKGKYKSFTFELTVGGEDYDKVSDLHVFGTAKAISTCNKVSGKDNTYVVEIRLDMTYFTDSGWKSNMNTFATSTGTAGSWDARSQMLLAWRYNGSNGFKNPNNQQRNYVFTIANFELRDTLLYSY